MITLAVIILAWGTLAADGWRNGDFTSNVYSFKTIATCEAMKEQMIKYALSKENEKGPVLIGSCEAPDDISQFRIFFPQGKPEIKPGEGSS